MSLVFILDYLTESLQNTMTMITTGHHVVRHLSKSVRQSRLHIIRTTGCTADAFWTAKKRTATYIEQIALVLLSVS